MIQRKTQTEQYWQEFSLNSADVEFLHHLFLDAEQPLATQALAQALVTEHCRREEAELRAELGRGVLYQPKKRFAQGEKVIFPALDFRLGEVVDVRPGQNPEYGEFEVITADFGVGRRQRSFAAGLTAAHKLNAELPDLLAGSSQPSPETLLATAARDLPTRLRTMLAGEPDFAGFNDEWLLKALLADIHLGHLNIAEALIEMRGTAVDSTSLQTELDLPAEISPKIAAFSLRSALAADGRFDQVGAGDEHAWFLRRLEPSEALEVPSLLRYEPVRYRIEDLTPDLQRLAWELDDEWSEDLSGDSGLGSMSATILLTYPHAASGTLPLNRRSRPLFPEGSGERTMVTLIDGRWGNRFSAWVNRADRYVAGLQPWFEKHKLPAGAFIVLERRDDTGEVVVDFRPKRMRREWTRWAQVTSDGQLDIQLRKQEIACEYDEQIVIGDDRSEEILKLRSSTAYVHTPLPELVYEVFSDLAGLSGSVHAKTVYSAVNVIRRCPPEAVFATMAADQRLERAGEGFFRLVA